MFSKLSARFFSHFTGRISCLSMWPKHFRSDASVSCMHFWGQHPLCWDSAQGRFWSLFWSCFHEDHEPSHWAIISDVCRCVWLIGCNLFNLKISYLFFSLSLQDHAQHGVTDKNGWTEMHQVAKRGFDGHAALLILYGANVDAQNDSGNTPLHICGTWNQENVAKV